MAPALRVAPAKAPLGVARCSFGTTKLRASRLACMDAGKGREQDAEALIGAFAGATVVIAIVLTGPSELKTIS